MTEKPFSLLIKPASAACNLRCSYCFYSGPLAHRKRTVGGSMDDDLLQRLLAGYFSTRQPVYTFTWQGGEPTLAGLDFFKRVVELQKKMAPPGSTVANGLQTNGTLLDEDWARFLSENRFLVGLSIDGPEPVHNMYRKDAEGRGTWSRVMAAWRCLQRHAVETNILCMVYAGNKDRAAELYSFFTSKGMNWQQYTPLVEFDRRGRLHDFSLRGEEWGRFLLDLFETWYPEDAGRVAIRNFDTLWALLATGDIQTCVLSPACDTYFVVEASGDVYPCDFFVKDSLKLGNIFETSWDDLARSGRYRTFAGKKTAGLPAECRSCPWLSFCRGGCLKYRQGGKKGYILCPSEKLYLSRLIPEFRRRLSSPH